MQSLLQEIETYVHKMKTGIMARFTWDLSVTHVVFQAHLLLPVDWLLYCYSIGGSRFIFIYIGQKS